MTEIMRINRARALVQACQASNLWTSLCASMRVLVRMDELQAAGLQPCVAHDECARARERARLFSLHLPPAC
eukprot:4416034-Pleurochrysis_carterae.AAC.1